MLEIQIIPILSDNYSFVIYNQQSKNCIVVDPGDGMSIINCLKSINLQVSHILVTHHHSDHILGIDDLLIQYGCKIVSSVKNLPYLQKIDIIIENNPILKINDYNIKPIITPGHTKGHVVYWFEDENILLCGDLLFSGGCGRVFEGTNSQMFSSLKKIMSLPDETIIYCAHEYTIKNLEFALTIEPENIEIQNYYKLVKEKSLKNIPSIPTKLSIEKKINPFLRLDSQFIRKRLHLENATELKVFAAIRALKDRF